MVLARSIAIRIAISLILCCAAFAMQAGSPTSDPRGVHAEFINMYPPAVVAISPRTFLRGSPSALLQIIATESAWPLIPPTVNEVLWNDTLLSTSVSSGLYQAIVPAGLLAVSQPITVSMRKRNTLTGEVSVSGLAQYAIVTDTIATPGYTPTIVIQKGDWQMNLMYAQLPITIRVHDRFGLPLASAPVLINTDYGVFGSGYNALPQTIVANTYSDGTVTIPLSIQTSQLTQTITATLNVTASTIFVGEFASATVSSTVVIPRATTNLPVVLWRHPPANHDFCSPVFLPPPPQTYSRPQNAPQDVYQPFLYAQLPPNEPVITMPRGIQISNYSAVGRLELHSVQQNQCFASGTISTTLLASTPIPPRNQQPFQWCPPEAMLKPADQYLLIVVRNDAERNFTNYKISANFPVSQSTSSGVAFCGP